MHIIDSNKNDCLINLNFAMESSSSLWNRIFEGFDQDSTIVSRFESETPEIKKLLYKFGKIVKQRYKNCTVEYKLYGIVIKKTVEDSNINFTEEWINLMQSLRDEISNLSGQ